MSPPYSGPECGGQDHPELVGVLWQNRPGQVFGNSKFLIGKDNLLPPLGTIGPDGKSCLRSRSEAKRSAGVSVRNAPPLPSLPPRGRSASRKYSFDHLLAFLQDEDRDLTLRAAFCTAFDRPQVRQLETRKLDPLHISFLQIGVGPRAVVVADQPALAPPSEGL